MSDFDLVIRGGIVVTGESGVGPQDIGIKQGQIVRLGETVFGSCDAELDATGLHIFPGLIDAQICLHCGSGEGWTSGGRLLAAGGVCTALDTSPAVRDRVSFDAACAAAAEESLVDFALWGALTPDTLDAMSELHECGVIGFHATLSGPGAIDDYTLLEGMLRARELGRVLALRAENDAITSRLARDAVAAGKMSVRDFLATRPVIAEMEAIQRAILFAWETGCALHLAPVSTGRGLELIAGARAQGLDISCATSPHYLLFTEDDAARLDALARCVPPLRSEENRAELWTHLRAGDIDFLTSDHRLPDADAAETTASGVAGGQLTLPLLLTETGAAGGSILALDQIVGWLSTHAARRFRIFPKKGSLAPDADADLVIVDLNQGETVVPESLYQQQPESSPYLGRALRGQIRRTILRGQTIYRLGTAPPRAAGQLLRPAPPAAAEPLPEARTAAESTTSSALPPVIS